MGHYYGALAVFCYVLRTSGDFLWMFFVPLALL